ncbi:MAG TPA: hypothetical protein VK302_02470 [Terriglobales bacterium]|nr:hypothetical protein [Terriglobales bacterium]
MPASRSKSSAGFLAIVQSFMVPKFMAPSEILRRWPDDDLVDFQLGRLLDGVSDRACESSWPE